MNAEPREPPRERPPFAGREAELGLLLDSVSRAPAVGLVAVMVSGEAGIGKSRLLTEAAEQLSARRWRLVAVRADRLERQIPYAALGTALRGMAADNTFTQDLRRAALAALDLPAATIRLPGSAEATRVPGGTAAGRATGGGTNPYAAAPGAAFGRACATVTSLLAALTAAGPLALLVDDLHELDDDSLALLTVVLRRLESAPVGLLAALRPHVAVPNPAAEDLLDRLADTAELVRIELGSLPPAATAAVIKPILGLDPDASLTREIHRRADGNPFFAIEIARSLAESGLITPNGGRPQLTATPPAVHLSRRNAVLRRVLPLAPDARVVARTLAVLRTASLDRIGLIAEIASLPSPAVTAAFDALVGAHVVTLDAGQRYRFCHDIVGEALYDEIGPAECRRLHRLVADRLVGGRLLGGRPGGGRVDLLELAWHVSESAEPGETAAVEVLTEAAQHVLSRAPEAAAGFCGRALAVMGENAPQRAGLLALQCRALARASRPAAAVPPGRAALALLPAGDERFRTATAVISSLFWLGRVDDALEVADEQVRAGPARPALHAQRAVLLVFAGRTSEALAEAATAAGSVLTAGPVPGPVAVPGAEPDPGQAPIPGSVPAAESAQVAVSRAEEVVVHCQLAVLNSMLFRHTETVECADWALRASEGSTTLRLQALIVCAWTEALAGLVPDAARRLRLAEQLVGAIDARQVFPGEVTASAATRDALPGELDARHAFFGELGLTKILLHWFGGRWGAALEGIRGVAAELESRHQSLLAPALTAVELEMRTWRGELVIAERLAAQRAPRARNMASLHAWAVAGFLAARHGESVPGTGHRRAWCLTRPARSLPSAR